MSLERLKLEIENDPKGLGYQGKTADAIFKILSEKNRPRIKSISSAELLAWSAVNNRYMKLKNAAETSGPAQSVACVSMILLNRDDTTLDLNLTDRMNMVNGLVQLGILNDDDKTDLMELGTAICSRFEELNLQEYHSGDIEMCIIK